MKDNFERQFVVSPTGEVKIKELTQQEKATIDAMRQRGLEEKSKEEQEQLSKLTPAEWEKRGRDSIAKWLRDIVEQKNGEYSEALIIEKDGSLNRERRLNDDVPPYITLTRDVRTPEDLYNLLYKIQEENPDLRFSFDRNQNDQWIKYTVKVESQLNRGSAESEKEIAWEQRRQEVDKITDNLGLGVDEKIKEAVTAFRVHEFATNQSCEGHIGEGEKHGATFPWIEIYAPEPKGWNEAGGEQKNQIEKEWMVKNLEQQQKMMGFLAEFYQGREILFDVRLTFSSIGAFGGFRVQSFGAEIMKLLSSEEQLKKFEFYRKEMDDFSKFLKDKYFSGK